MWRGLYTAATGMITEQTRTATIANNLANINTTGYKRDRALDSEFEPMLIRRINDDTTIKVTDFKGFSLDRRGPVVGTLGLGAHTREIATDHTQGSMQATGNPLDLAISGEGYFTIDTPNGVRYTRNGSFYRSVNGDLVNSDGRLVLSDRGGAINIPANAASVTVAPTGEIFADRQRIGRIGLVDFGGDRRAVLKEGDSMFYAQEGAQPQPATGEIQQGVLERSNANVINEMVELINNYRVYEANSRAVTTQDTMLDHSVNEVGRLG